MRNLFIIEGIDGSGKSTQVELLRQRLEEQGRIVRRIKLPNYSSPACAPVEQYLSGAYGSDADSVNAYAASAFFAVDRFAYFRTDWQADYESEKIILSDRYVSSNLIHQCSKLPQEKREEYMTWLHDFEYEKMGSPRPTAVFYLDVPPMITSGLMTGRYEGDEGKKDIHERDGEYLRRCYEMGLYCCEHHGFIRIPCLDQDGKMLPREVICDSILRRIESMI